MDVSTDKSVLTVGGTFEVAEGKASVTLRRRITGLVFGLYYGGTIGNGVDEGLAYVTKNKEFYYEHRLLSVVVETVAIPFAALATSYVARSPALGVLAGAVAALVCMAFAVGIHEAALVGPLGAYAIGFVASLVTAWVGVRLPVVEDDVERGRLLGIRWPHWLWLGVVWVGLIANAVWLGTPLSFLAARRPGLLTVTWDVGQSIIALGILAMSALKVIEAMRYDFHFRGWRRAGVVAFWVLICPFLANLWRMFARP